MLLFDRKVKAAAANAAAGDAVRYAAQRWAELLDEHTHFSQSASGVVVPTVACREVFEEAQSYVGDKRAHFSNMLECFKQTRDTLRLERNAGRWFPAERTALLTALAATDPIPRNQDPDQWVTQVTNALVTNELAALQAVLDNPANGYRPRLLDLVYATLVTPPQTSGAWRVFDENLTYLAALALSEGRGGWHLALATADAFTAARSPEAAADSFRELLEGTPERYVAAACIEGANSIRRLGTFGCAAVGDPATWPHGNHGQSGTRLRQFLAQRLDGRRRACALFVEVDALDPEHARELALAKIALLHDHIAAEHRIARFGVDAEVLILREATNATVRIGGDERTVESAKPLGGRPLPSLQRSLRFYKLARSEEAAVVAVVQSWIAMENLARGARAYLRRGGVRKWVRQNPAAFLPQHVGAVIYLAAARNQVISAWHLARGGCSQGANAPRFMELSRWLGVTPARQWFVDLDQWLKLLGATPAAVAPDPLPLTATPGQAAALLRDLLANATPYVRIRLEDAAGMVRTPARLAEWSARVERRARANVSRLRMLRNRVVHGAMPDHTSARQVAAAGRHLLDAIFEVVPHWLGGGVQVWRALYNARTWQESLRKRWRAPGSSIGASLDQIVHGP